MMQRLKTLWQQLTHRFPQRTAPGDTDTLAALTTLQQDLLKVRWWYWRHFFLEAKRQTLEARRDH